MPCLRLFVGLLAVGFMEYPPTIAQETTRTETNEIIDLQEEQLVSQKLNITLFDWKIITYQLRGNYQNSEFCTSCQKITQHVINYRRTGASRENVRVVANNLCQIFTDWKPEVCSGYVNIELDTVLYILDNRKDLTAERVCSIYFQDNGCVDPNHKGWLVDITPRLPRKPNTPFKVQNQNDSLKILQLTDFHYDPEYTPGSEANCGMGLCCQAENGAPELPESAAGFWGDYHSCDTPWHTIKAFTNYVTKTHKDIDYVYYTGDIISHKSWATSKPQNIQTIKALYDLFNTTFGKVPVLPILGNHEPHPTNFYSSPDINSRVDYKISTQWVFDLAASEWQKWLPSMTKDTILKGGYYTLLIRPGFRIVALNSNVCFTKNLWLIYEDNDPYDQLKWLNQVLTEAEKNNEKVHILSHIPPGESDSLKDWSLNYKRIVQRFAHIISAQFNGHTHFDELRLFRDEEQSKIINVAFNAGSFTTFVGLNPNYRLYNVNPDNLQVLDYDQYTFNLSKANQNTSLDPQWYKLYSLKDAYKMTGAGYEDFTDLLTRMENFSDEILLKQYYKFRYRESEVAMAAGCDDKCLQGLLCSIVAVDFESIMKCNNIE